MNYEDYLTRNDILITKFLNATLIMTKYNICMICCMYVEMDPSPSTTPFPSYKYDTHKNVK